MVPYLHMDGCQLEIPSTSWMMTGDDETENLHMLNSN